MDLLEDGPDLRCRGRNSLERHLGLDRRAAARTGEGALAARGGQAAEADVVPTDLQRDDGGARLQRIQLRRVAWMAGVAQPAAELRELRLRRHAMGLPHVPGACAAAGDVGQVEVELPCHLVGVVVARPETSERRLELHGHEGPRRERVAERHERGGPSVAVRRRHCGREDEHRRQRRRDDHGS